MTSHATLLTLVRHGETDWNIEHRLQGQLQPGPSLNATGQQQAALVWTARGWSRASCTIHLLMMHPPANTQQVAACLATKHVDALYASDLARAQETLRIIHKTLPDGTHVRAFSCAARICRHYFSMDTHILLHMQTLHMHTCCHSSHASRLVSHYQACESGHWVSQRA